MTAFAPDRPYNDLPLLPPPDDIETKAVLKACIEARAAIAELKQCGSLIPNQLMLINTIPVLEAQGSSAIENIVTTADRLFQLASAPDTPVDAATKEAFRYSRALFSGFQSIQARSQPGAMALGSRDRSLPSSSISPSVSRVSVVAKR